MTRRNAARWVIGLAGLTTLSSCSLITRDEIEFGPASIDGGDDAGWAAHADDAGIRADAAAPADSQPEDGSKPSDSIDGGSATRARDSGVEDTSADAGTTIVPARDGSAPIDDSPRDAAGNVPDAGAESETNHETGSQDGPSKDGSADADNGATPDSDGSAARDGSLGADADNVPGAGEEREIDNEMLAKQISQEFRRQVTVACECVTIVCTFPTLGATTGCDSGGAELGVALECYLNVEKAYTACFEPLDCSERVPDPCKVAYENGLSECETLPYSGSLEVLETCLPYYWGV